MLPRPKHKSLVTIEIVQLLANACGGFLQCGGFLFAVPLAELLVSQLLRRIRAGRWAVLHASKGGAALLPSPASNNTGAARSVKTRAGLLAAVHGIAGCHSGCGSRHGRCCVARAAGEVAQRCIASVCIVRSWRRCVARAAATCVVVWFRRRAYPLDCVHLFVRQHTRAPCTNRSRRAWRGHIYVTACTFTTETSGSNTSTNSVYILCGRRYDCLS